VVVEEHVVSVYTVKVVEIIIILVITED